MNLWAILWGWLMEFRRFCWRFCRARLLFLKVSKGGSSGLPFVDLDFHVGWKSKLSLSIKLFCIQRFYGFDYFGEMLGCTLFWHACPYLILVLLSYLIPDIYISPHNFFRNVVCLYLYSTLYSVHPWWLDITHCWSIDAAT